LETPVEFRSLSIALAGPILASHLRDRARDLAGAIVRQSAARLVAGRSTPRRRATSCAACCSVSGAAGMNVSRTHATRNMTAEDVLRPLTPELNVRDLTKSLDFYVRLLGFSVQFARFDEGFAAMALGGAALMLEQIDTFDAASDLEFVEQRKWITGKLEHPFGRGLNIQIHMTDLDAVYDRLLKNNYPIKLPIEERWYPGQQ